MVHDEVIYRCVNGACARALPRRVEYCPYCGTSQSTGLPRPGNVATPPPVSIAKPAPIPASMQMPATPAAVPPTPAPPIQPPRAAMPAPPPQREPVKLRYWLLALGALWLIWITQRPSPKKIDARVDNAIALARACKAVEAQAELIALKNSSATAAQLQRLQGALNDAGAACDNMRPRSRPAPKPGRQLAGQQAQSARNLIADARLAMAAGDYRAASDKMEVCAAMIEGGNRECSALKAKADRLQGELQRCLADGREWSADRCQ